MGMKVLGKKRYTRLKKKKKKKGTSELAGGCFDE
jgi:hypothetical protein